MKKTLLLGAGASRAMMMDQVANRAIQAKRFRLERNSVLRSLDPHMMTAFFLRWKQPLPDVWAKDKPDAQLACMHYARIQCEDMLDAERLTSAKWLVQNTYSLPSGWTISDDGKRLVYNKPNNPDADKPNFGMDGPDEGSTQ